MKTKALAEVLIGLLVAVSCPSAWFLPASTSRGSGGRAVDGPTAGGRDVNRGGRCSAAPFHPSGMRSARAGRGTLVGSTKGRLRASLASRRWHRPRHAGKERS